MAIILSLRLIGHDTSQSEGSGVRRKDTTGIDEPSE